MVVRHIVDAERNSGGGYVERVRIEVSVDFEGAPRMSAQAVGVGLWDMGRDELGGRPWPPASALRGEE